MGTTTERTTHAVTRAYTDLTVSIPGAANMGGFVRHLGGAVVEIVKGGSQPAIDVRGIPINPGDEEWCDTDHIWVRCRHGDAATLLFELVS